MRQVLQGKVRRRAVSIHREVSLSLSFSYLAGGLFVRVNKVDHRQTTGAIYGVQSMFDAVRYATKCSAD